ASSSAASTWWRRRTSTRPSTSRRASPAPASAPSRCARSCRPRARSDRGLRPTSPASRVTALEAVYRDERGRALATLVRLLGDLDLAEESLQEAFVVAV